MASEGKRCKNYEVCRRKQIRGRGLCGICDNGDSYGPCFRDLNGWDYYYPEHGYGWKELDIQKMEGECPICLENVNTMVKFPTKKCSHMFCVECMRRILIWDVEEYKLSPVYYGCPPCPNGCINPQKGRQCGCEEYGEILNDKVGVVEKWRRENKEKCEEWLKEQDDNIVKNLISEENTCGNMKCPMCRSQYYHPSFDVTINGHQRYYYKWKEIGEQIIFE